MAIASERRHVTADTVIDWTPATGKSDWLMGSGTTRLERALVWATVASGLIAAVWLGSPEWRWWEWAIVVFLVVDVVGGVTANALSTAKRQYHGSPPPNQSALTRVLRDRRLFTVAHVHPFLVALLIADASWSWASYWYIGCLGAVLFLHWLPLYAQRPAGFAAVTVLILFAPTVDHPMGLAWFGPVLAIKLIAAHALREEPYRPATETTQASRASLD